MAFKVPALLDLEVRQDGKGGHCVNLEAFVKFLLKNRDESDSIQIRKDTITREISKTFWNGIVEVDDAQHISRHTVLKYAFKHCDQLKICKRISHQVLARCISKEDKAEIPCTSNLELYKAVSNASLRNDYIDKFMSKNVKIDESSIWSLWQEYRGEFSCEQWHRICIFEKNFIEAKCKLGKTYPLGELMDMKWDFLKVLKDTKEFAKQLQSIAKVIISERNKRKQASEKENSVYIIGTNGILHDPTVLESEVMEELISSYNVTNITNIVCIDCVPNCTHPQGIHVVVLCDDIKYVDEIKTLVCSEVEKHKSKCVDIVITKQEAVNSWVEHDTIMRFHLRDSLLKGEVDVVHHWQLQQDEDDSDSMDLKGKCCQLCYTTKLANPLSWTNFDITSEWSMDIPLYMQILFESFINPKTLRQTDDIMNVIETKLTSLYNTVDILLNVYNRNYFGVLQEKNTNHLIMNYKCVRTVFNITSKTGATLSLNAAEQRLKAKTSRDLCYFNTYLKKYPIEYECMPNFISVAYKK